MKKLIVFFLPIFISITSCKKDRTCSCTITKTGTSTTQGKAYVSVIPGFPLTLADTSFVTPIYDVQTIDKKLEKLTKTRAKNNCISYTEPYKETVLTSIPVSSVNLSLVLTNEGEKHYECKLK